MLFIGKNRAEAIDAIQEMLGPVTPRNIAEDTYRALVAEGVIDIDTDCIILEAEMDTEELRTRARNSVIASANQRAGTARRAGRRGRSTGQNSGKTTKHTRNHNRHSRVTDNSADATNKKIDDDQD